MGQQRLATPQSNDGPKRPQRNNNNQNNQKKQSNTVLANTQTRRGEVFRAQRRTSDDVNLRASQHVINIPVNKSIINGYEGWIEYRRTGFPKLKTISASLNQNLIPVRLPYPTTEDALNNANFRAAASKTNNNSVNSPVWWDK